jgi:hypothetical protein
VEKELQSDGVVCALYAPKSIGPDTIRTGDPFNQRLTRKFLPRSLTSRIVAQEGLFTVQPSVETPLSEQLRDGWEIERVIIPASCKPSMMGELFRAGITRASLFPGLDGLAHHLEWEHTRRPKRDGKGGR